MLSPADGINAARNRRDSACPATALRLGYIRSAGSATAARHFCAPPEACCADLLPPWLLVHRHRVELQPVVDQLVAQPPRDLRLQALDLLGLELDHLTSPQIDEMVVMGIGHLLVAGAAVAEIVPFDNAGIFEQLHGAIDGRDGNAIIDR